MDAVMAYRTAREGMITRTKENVSKDEKVHMVEEAHESGIECEDEDGPLTTNEM